VAYAHDGVEICKQCLTLKVKIREKQRLFLFHYKNKDVGEKGMFDQYSSTYPSEGTKKTTKKSPKAHLEVQSANRPEIELKVACDVKEYAEFAKIYGFYDVTRNFELDFQAIG